MRLIEFDKQPLDVKTMSVDEIAKQHDVSVEVIQHELEAGIKVEREHTSSDQAAKEIALDHLAELPDYYSKLDKMETE